MSLKARIVARIRAKGPMPVSDYMAACLAQYYTTRDPLGEGGDFTTAPEISQIFGELAGAWIAAEWQRQGEGPALLAELGPGRGTLMADALRATRHVPGFHDAVRIQLVEINPSLREKQQATLANAHPRIEWVENVTPPPEGKLLVIANEFFDCMPIRQFIANAGAWHERAIAERAGNLQWIATEAPTPLLRAAANDGAIAEVSPESERILQAIARVIVAQGGAAFVADYGYAHGPHAPTHRGDTLQALCRHAYVDPLENPGEADVTAHVDFAALQTCVRATGAQIDYGTQGTFLRRMGAEIRAETLCGNASPETRRQITDGLERLMHPEKMGELFKVLLVTPS